VKKLLQLEKAGRDIEKDLQRYILGLAAHDEKLQLSWGLGERCYPCVPNDRICETLKIFLSDRSSQFLHTFSGITSGVFSGNHEEEKEENDEESK
jgi:hypothetical protein